jgi:hypothetical protein
VSLEFVVKHLRWVSHSLTDTQKAQRLALWNKLLCKVRSVKHQGWQFIIILDEVRFYLTTDYERIWLWSDQEPPERQKRTIQDTKIMATITWNPLRFHRVDSLPKGMTFNAYNYRDNILAALIAFGPGRAKKKVLFMQTMQRLMPLKTLSPFVPKTGWDWPYTGRTRLISHSQTSLWSDMLNTVCRGSRMHYTKSGLH